MIEKVAKSAQSAFIHLSALPEEVRNNALKEIASALKLRGDEIEKANNQDLENSIKNNYPQPLVKRLKFDQAKIQEVVDGIQSLIQLPDPIGITLSATELDAGLELYKVTSPIGVIGVIFESRPDALIQISTLCLKSGNAVLLKGGSEAMNTNHILADIIYTASLKAGIPENWMHLLETRSDVNQMLKLDEYIDLIIPRGSNEFVKYIMDNSNISVLGHADGICHVFADQSADIDMAIKVIEDSKCQYVAVCNATETLLVHDKIAAKLLPGLKTVLDKHQVRLIGCQRTAEIIDVELANEQDWKTEYLDYTLSIKIVDNIDEAIQHINTYGSGHTDAIITQDEKEAVKFMNLVDSGDVFWNCSTRFSDGFRYGLGAEVGVSTNKIHARGPVGLEGLMIYKWRLIGNGNIVSDYSSGKKKFTHKKLDKKYPL